MNCLLDQLASYRTARSKLSTPQRFIYDLHLDSRYVLDNLDCNALQFAHEFLSYINIYGLKIYILD